MSDLFVAFTPVSADALARAQQFFALIKMAKETGDTVDPAFTARLETWLTEAE